MARLHTETIPTSTLASTARVVDGFVTTQTDHQGITSSFTRAYTATGITQTATDGRGNTTTTHTDLAGRTISSTDAAGNTTTTVYDEDFDQPSVITNAQGKTSCYKYDLRGRKVAEWGTAIQSPRRLVGGLDKRAAFARRARSREAAPSQVFSSGGTILTAYTYTPYGAVTANGNVTQPIQWSSEYNDIELGLVYYNYRHYNPTDGRWINEDLLEQSNLYAYKANNISLNDYLGLTTDYTLEPCQKECSGHERFRKTELGCCEYRTTEQKKDYTPSCNGCGGENASWDYVPDFYFEEACNRHDICYGTCGLTKEDCDNKFKTDMYAICEKIDIEWWSQTRYDFIGDLVHGARLSSCKLMADMYYGAVVMWGEAFYADAQDEACVWKSCAKH